MIQVSDNRKGISPQALSHVFDSFFRADTAPHQFRARQRPGAGHLPEHCGKPPRKIWLTSEEGEGTRAFLYLPLQKEEGVLR